MVSIRWPFGQAGRGRAPEAKESRAGGVIALSGVGRPRWTPNDYASLAREGYQKNAVAYRCIRMIAEAAAAAPFAVFVDGVRDEAHPLAKLIRRPNPEQSGAELMEAVYGALQVSGNAYVEATGDADGDGAPDELWALRSDRVKVIPGRSGWPEAWDYSREIALAFGVPPQLLGIPGDATYANYREANAAFWRQTVIPLVRKAAGAMTGWLGERFAGCEVRADLEGVAALQPERDALWARLEAASFLTDEERRRMAGVGREGDW